MPSREKSNSDKVWIRRLLAAYCFIFVVGMAFYTGTRWVHLLTEPNDTLVDIGFTALGALIVGVGFAAVGAFFTFITLLINDALERRSARPTQPPVQTVSKPPRPPRRNRTRIYYSPTH